MKTHAIHTRSRFLALGGTSPLFSLVLLLLFGMTTHIFAKGAESSADGAEDWVEPTDWTETASSANWGESKPTPTVVHPAVVSPLQRILSLRGEWEIQPDPGHRYFEMSKRGLPEEFWEGARKIQVPGCWEAQGVGEPGWSQPWDITDRNPHILTHVYMGRIAYRKKFDLPADWDGQEIWLKIGGVRTKGNFWVNNHPVGVINNYCGTYKFNITPFVQPGETTEILASVRNDLPGRKGGMNDFHRFGGIYRDIELEATPKTWIDDVWVEGKIENRGEAPKRTARVHFTPGTVTSKEHADVTIQIKTRSGDLMAEKKVSLDVTEDSKEAVIDIPVEGAELWSTESPTLYLADVTLSSKSANHGWTERFGFRKLEVIGTRFFLNNQPFFARGYGESFIYPMALVSPADRDYHINNMRPIKEAGFNQTRMHTHCQLPEYFEAADEMGILVEPELPYYNQMTCEAFFFDPARDLKELYRHYRRYTSFAFYSMGNEGYLGEEIAKELHRWIKRVDPSRPSQHQEGWLANNPDDSDFGSMPHEIWPRGMYDDTPFPFIAHEYMNLSVKLDPRLEPLFTGPFVSPVSMENYQKELDEAGLSREMGDQCIRAAHALQAYYQKKGLESARIDPECDGFNFWNFVDQMVLQGSACTSQGYMNIFYQVKDGGLTPKEFAEFNTPTVILSEIDSDGDIFQPGDEMKVDFWISHFGTAPLPAGAIDWTLTEAGNPMISGSVPFESFDVGDVRIAANEQIEIPPVDHAAEWDLRATIRGTSITNHWKIYVFPDRGTRRLNSVVVDPELAEWFGNHYDGLVVYGDPEMKPTDALVAVWGSECYEKGIKEGRRVLAIRPTEGSGNINLGWWWFGPQLGTAFADHPAFGDFPHKGWMNPTLWFRILGYDALDLDGEVDVIEPLAVGNKQAGYKLHAGICRDGNSKVLATFGLNLLQDKPEALALLDDFIDYVSGPEF